MPRKLTPVLFTQAIEPVLAFWVNRLGFRKIAEVPEGDRLGFLILERDGMEVMYQTYRSLDADLPGVASPATTASVSLYMEVIDLDQIEAAFAGVPADVPRRQTAYGATEIGWREPAGHLVLFAKHSQVGAL